jgi:bifunctional DNA-binding transcriptional regulator/antitoxin component of YhaV-PrlF toxin-antitoxin module
MKFRAKVESAGKTATGITVPDEVVESLGSSKRPAVEVTINGFTYRSTIAPMGGKYKLSISADNREKAGVAAGDEVEVSLQLDLAPREVVVPPALEKVFKDDSIAKVFFETLSYSKKLWLVLQITDAKTEETRARRVEKVIGILHSGKV